MQQQAPVALDAAALAVLAPYVGPRRERERSPPRGDRRPLSTRNRSRERRAAAGGDQESYGQLREKAVKERSKTVPAKESFYIGDEMKRSRPVLPRNQAALKRQAAPRPAAVKREASVPAEDRRTRARGVPRTQSEQRCETPPTRAKLGWTPPRSRLRVRKLLRPRSRRTRTCTNTRPATSRPKRSPSSSSRRRRRRPPPFRRPREQAAAQRTSSASATEERAAKV